VTRPKKLRSRLVAAALLLLATAAFAALAPTTIGGSASYVTTRGVSMEPRFHTGDMAVIRRAGRYRVGDVVAYHSTTLHTVVMHRIIARSGERYVFKGDNNNFVDPDRPDRGELIGKLWLRVPRAGGVSDTLHTPAITALLSATAFALLLFLGTGRRHRRRDRRRGDPPQHLQGARPVASQRTHITAKNMLAASAITAVAAGGLGLLAFTRPATRAVTVKSPYTERVSFGYRADVASSAVYPGGVVTTGDPVFLRLVHRVRVSVKYRLAASAPHRLGGSMQVFARLTSPSGWSRRIPLSSPMHFTGDRAASEVTLDLRRLRALVDHVEKLTGGSLGAAYTLAIAPRVHLAGTLSGRPLRSDFSKELRFQVDTLQMKREGDATSAGVKDAQLTPSQRGTVATASTAPNKLGIRGHGPPVVTARWIALAGLLLAAAAAWLSRQPGLRRPANPAAHARARYGHLIVPIAGIATDPARAPIDVTSMDALVKLAERSERLILHHHRDDGDTYLIDDEGTLYRYQAGAAGPRYLPQRHAAAGSLP
jgi:signal peptidase I